MRCDIPKKSFFALANEATTRTDCQRLLWFARGTQAGLTWRDLLALEGISCAR